MKDRLDWFKDTVSAETAAAMPHHMQVSWFNYVRPVLAALRSSG